MLPDKHIFLIGSHSLVFSILGYISNDPCKCLCPVGCMLLSNLAFLGIFASGSITEFTISIFIIMVFHFKMFLVLSAAQRLFFKDFIYLFFRGRRREEEREGEKYQLVASCMPPTRDLACNPGMCPGQESNWRPFGSLAGAQSTEPPQPGQILYNK